MTETERDFWDHHVPPLTECLRLYEAGPDPFTSLLFDAAAVARGQRVLDFACGVGLSSAWLSARGAEVVAVDVSPISIRRATELRDTLGLDYDLRLVDVGEHPNLVGESFDRVIGRFALHHLDLMEYAPLLSSAVSSDGQAAFIETMATNPMLRLARSQLPGRFGIPKWGTPDEHPLTRADLGLLEQCFGSLKVTVPEMYFFRMVELQVLRGRLPRAARVLDRIDGIIGRYPRLGFLSYYQVLTLGGQG